MLLIIIMFVLNIYYAQIEDKKAKENKNYINEYFSQNQITKLYKNYSGWVEINQYFYIYMANGKMIAEIFADDGAVWTYKVYIKRHSISSIFIDHVGCKDTAFDKVEKILKKFYWM